jgi:co-chaperonin GroES (HSP10)
MIQCPVNSLLLQIGDVFVKKPSVIMQESMAYAHGSTLNPADLVQIVGKVISIPKGIMTDVWGYEGYSTKDIYPDDMAIIRYDVVYSFDQGKKHFKNLFYFEGTEYWLAGIHSVFGVIRAGEIIMVNGYCMVEDYSNASALIIPQHMKHLIEIGTATLSHIGNNLTNLPKIDAQQGDTVYYNPNLLQKYEINGTKFGILKQKDIMGVCRASYSDLRQDLSWKR